MKFDEQRQKIHAADEDDVIDGVLDDLERHIEKQTERIEELLEELGEAKAEAEDREQEYVEIDDVLDAMREIVNAIDDPAGTLDAVDFMKVRDILRAHGRDVALAGGIGGY